MSIVIVIIGLFYCLLRLSSEKIQSNVIDKENKKRSADYIKNLNALRAPPELERDLREKFWARDKALYNEVYEFCSHFDFLRELKLDPIYAYSYDKDYSCKLAVSIYLINRGMIPFCTNGPRFVAYNSPQRKVVVLTDEQRKALCHHAQTAFHKYHPDMNIVWCNDCYTERIQIDVLATFSRDYTVL